MATKRKLPNLKICVDNTQSSDESDREHGNTDLSDSGDENIPFKGQHRTTRRRSEDGTFKNEAVDEVLSIAVTEPTERRFLSRNAIIRQKPQPTFGPRLYENKSGDFVTGVDVTSEEATEQREKRAERFGTLTTPKQPITDVDIKNLYKSLGMTTDTLDQDLRGWRTDVILLRGTQNMSTKDIFDYFCQYAPKGIEWIDDFSCNVVWQDKLTPARAMLKLSVSMEEAGCPNQPSQQLPDILHGVSPLNRDKVKAQLQVVAEADQNVSKEAASTEGTEKTNNSQNTTSKVQAKPVGTNQATDELTLEDEQMELDYDDNLDLSVEDPIDQALNTWAKFSQNKKLRSEQAKEASVKKQTEPSEHSENNNVQVVLPGSIIIKEESDVDKKASKNSDKQTNKSDTSEQKHSIPSTQKVQSSSRVDKALPPSKSSKIKHKLKDNKLEKSKVSHKKLTKMDVSDDESDSESGSSYSSSSGSGSSSSVSSSSSGSESESESGSSSSAESATEASKNQKTKVVPDKSSKKIVKKPEPPPILPQAREKVDIPWPPGWWRLGLPHPKAEFLFLRYAMKADKKLPGAEKRSQYYVKHGNPNFGGIVGLISTSRKRKIRNVVGRGRVVDEGPEENLFEPEPEVEESVQSRLAGRLGSREDGQGEPGSRQRLKPGKDLRDLLNRDASAIQIDAAKEEAKYDSDDEMDYGAELERLMGKDAPAAKKRFMRMHADDEEEKIMAKRITKMQEERRRQLLQAVSLDKNENWDEDDEEEEVKIPYKSRRTEYVDYDNIEDDDPFNLFGTGKPNQAVSGSGSRDQDSDDEYRTSKREEHTEKARPRSVKQRLGGSDLRAKIEDRNRVSNRNW